MNKTIFVHYYTSTFKTFKTLLKAYYKCLNYLIWNCSVVTSDYLLWTPVAGLSLSGGRWKTEDFGAEYEAEFPLDQARWPVPVFFLRAYASLSLSPECHQEQISCLTQHNPRTRLLSKFGISIKNLLSKPFPTLLNRICNFSLSRSFLPLCHVSVFTDL